MCILSTHHQHHHTLERMKKQEGCGCLTLCFVIVDHELYFLLSLLLLLLLLLWLLFIKIVFVMIVVEFVFVIMVVDHAIFSPH